MKQKLVSWSLTSLFNTNMAISETKMKQKTDNNSTESIKKQKSLAITR